MKGRRRLYKRFDKLGTSGWAMLGLAALCSCGKMQANLPAIAEEPVPAKAVSRDLPELIPGYGIALGGRPQRFEVNIEAGDAARLRVGETATVIVPPDRRPVPARVARVLKNASEETGQALAWLEAEGPSGVPANEFVYASIVTSVRRHALAVPEAAVLVRDGKTWVVEQSTGAAWSPVQVSLGVSAGGWTEVVSGLHAGATVAQAGGIGRLYPDFKAASGD